MTNMKTTTKTVYGKELVYPACETAKLFTQLLVVKTFNPTQLRQIAALGVDITNDNNLAAL